jgi:hypothetical protein
MRDETVPDQPIVTFREGGAEAPPSLLYSVEANRPHLSLRYVPVCPRQLEVAKSSRYLEDLQRPLRYPAFIVSVALLGAFQAAQTAQGIIDRLRF